MREIPLTQGKVALVDDEDFELISQYKWHAQRGGSTWYAYRSSGVKSISMHRQIAQPPDEKFIDHRDGNGLNNTRKNLRECTNQQNQRNRRKGATRKSPYKGVTSAREKWRADIYSGGVRTALGSFAVPEEAARAYDRAAIAAFGEFAQINGV
jgi:hypothetical protein